MDNIYRRIEAWGYPRRGTDWLRRQRVLVIILLAVLSWSLCIALLVGIYFLGAQLVGWIAGRF